FQGHSRRDSRSVEAGRCQYPSGNLQGADPDLQRRSGLYGTAVADSVLERSVLVAEPDLIERRAVDRIDRLLFQPRRVVLGQAFGGVDPGLGADPDLRLDQPETAGARPVVRGRQMSSSNLNSTHFKNKNK